MLFLQAFSYIDCVCRDCVYEYVQFPEGFSLFLFRVRYLVNEGGTIEKW